jgi:hypothetical protein
MITLTIDKNTEVFYEIEPSHKNKYNRRCVVFDTNNHVLRKMHFNKIEETVFKNSVNKWIDGERRDFKLKDVIHTATHIEDKDKGKTTHVTMGIVGNANMQK